MNTTDFLDAVNASLNSKGWSAKLSEVAKENNAKQYGVMLANCEVECAPVVYITDAMLENADAPKQVANTLLHALEKAQGYNGLLANLSKSYILDRVVPEVVNVNTCEAWLDGKAHHMLFSDLCVIFRLVIDLNDEGMESIIIPTDWLEMYDISYNDLMTRARQVADDNFTFSDMFAVMCGFFGDDVPPSVEEESKESGLFILSNTSNVYGASSLLSNKALNMIHEKLGDVYIIPSSIHEVLILPCEAGGDVLEMAQMIQEINRTTVKPREVLGNHAYKYDGISLQDA